MHKRLTAFSGVKRFYIIYILYYIHYKKLNLPVKFCFKRYINFVNALPYKTKCKQCFYELKKSIKAILHIAHLTQKGGNASLKARIAV